MSVSKKSGGAKKSFGQNFLIDEGVIDRIIDAAGISEGDAVIEIGPGRGALTFPMIRRGAAVTAIEIERDVIAFLRSQIDDAAHLNLIECDALRVDFSQFGGRRSKLVANLPYNISTAILQRLIEHRQNFDVLVLMFQREVVERIAASPGAPDRGFLSVLAQRYFDVAHLFDVPPRAFRPVPKVTSAVCRLIPKALPDNGSERLFRDLVSTAFAQRRKTIANNLKGSPNEHFSLNPIHVLLSAGIDPRRRAETLTNAEWETLSDRFSAKPGIA